MSRIKLLMEVKEDAENLASSVGSLLAALESDEEKEEVKDEDNKSYKLEDVRKVLADKSRLGFTGAIKNLLEKHGATKLSEIDPSKYKDLLADVEKL